ncbi:response regulator transcription factor [Ferruginibacter albus]|uniref:response regulator transcription factor n=1 Tax=Ferruginibacter albus TaxID=2875540 RepID=UPI001CC36882|nr:response regulator transcription factor [Ferruginibacter albus]UAY51251.1 response regulator transcription factor [Ferruginibacter albus]
MNILIVEDEKSLSENIADYLKRENYNCEIAADLAGAINKIDEHEYDCILLDITIPGGSGLQLLKELKAERKSDGVLIISAKDSLDDKIAGLNLGADDYLSKPFHLSELGARVAAIIRRKNFEGNSNIEFNDIVIDTQAKQATVFGRQLELTKKEYELLLYFISNKRRVISKNAIAEHLWRDGASDNHDFIYTHIKNLRKKLLESGSEDYIKSIYGMGYKFTD